jgi:hypothetical protein
MGDENNNGQLKKCIQVNCTKHRTVPSLMTSLNNFALFILIFFTTQQLIMLLSDFNKLFP